MYMSVCVTLPYELNILIQIKTAGAIVAVLNPLKEVKDSTTYALS